MKLVLIYLGILVFIQENVSGWRRRRRRNPPPPPPPRNCVPSEWSQWSGCSHQCGNAGTQTRSRGKSVTECCGGRCPYQFSETRPCNRNACRNGGRPTHGRCTCSPGWTGTCCERDVNECQRTPSPCAHKCHNVPGSFTCSCHNCYTKVGNGCDLRQCLIGGACYSYGTLNPGNPCQDCQKSREQVWTNNNALSCSDGNLCTRNDRCVNGVCRGTPFTCRSCESCDGKTCKIKPGFCVIDGKCYSNGNLRPGKPCQQCNSNNPTRWTANNNLKCSDGNVKTRNDRCTNGECHGQPFTCLSCQDHHKDACRLRSGHCIIKQNNVNTCFGANVAKPGNPCQWCSPSVSTSAWTNRNGITCDDGQKCTRSDRCQNGQCGGTSFKCNSLCQYCDGNGCSLHTGFGFLAGKCTCKIAGKDYSHQQLNPSNECQWCDLYDKSSKSSSVWSNRPSVSCNDGNDCTKQDLCQNGRCVGQAYSCRSSYEQSSCIQRSVCLGDGNCKDIMRSKGTICRAAKDQCDQPERCNGILGTCPPVTVGVIKLQAGQTSLTFSNFASSVSFQSITDKVYLKLTGFSVTCGTLAIKWSLLTSKDSCALGNNPKTLSNTKNQVLNGLTLQNGETYKVVAQAYDIRGQAGRPVCSNVVTIDTSKPSGGWVRDGVDIKDVQFQSSKTVSATWGGFKTTHGIAKYEVAVYHRSASKDIVLQSFTNVNLKVSFTKSFTAIADGNQIITKVRAYTKAGLYSEISSNGVIVDTSNPKPGIVSDGQVLPDLKNANWTTTYDARWTSFTDPHTPIVEYKLGVKRKNGGLVSSGLMSLGLKQSGQVTGLNLASGIEYCAVVEGVNAAGLRSQATSNCLLIDHDAPQPGIVNDGTSEDIDYQSGNTAFHGNWKGFSDGQQGSGLAEYKYKITDKSNKDVTSWVSSGLQTKITATGLHLKNGETYYLTVRAIDKVGLHKDVRSDGVFIDTSHPVYTGSVSIQGEMAQENGGTVVYIADKDSITVSWPQFIDEHSGMKKYQWSIVEKNVQPTSWKDVPGVNLATTAVFRSLSLTNNKYYRLRIRGINNAGLHKDIRSPLIIPLSSAPDLGMVSDGDDASTDIDYQTNTSYIHATWKGFDTTSVKVRAYFFAVGSCVRGNYHVTDNQFIPVKPPTATSFHLQGLNLVNGQRYCVKVKAENLAGVPTSPVSSDGLIVDVTPPDTKRAMILDGNGDDDIDFQFSKNELSATWTGIQDHDSGIHHFEVAVSRKRAGQPDVAPFIDVGLAMSANISGLSLHNDVYYVIVCAINNARLKSCLASDGVLIDPTVSTSGVVHDGILEPDIRYQSSTTKMSANWEKIWDLESRVEKFEWAIGEDYPGSVLPFVDVGLRTHVTSEKVLALRHAHNYTVYLRIYNRAGGVRELTSNGITIDTTPPWPSEITFLSSEWRFNQETGIYYSSTALGIHVTWRDFEERESKVWYYKWAIGTSKCGTQLQPLINIGLATRANTTGSDLLFRPGVPYYVTVVARNRADIASRACSSPLLFDNTAPVAGVIWVTSHTGTEKSYVRSDEHLYLSWSGFEDFESGIEKYEISLLQSGTPLRNYTVPTNEAELDLSLNVLHSGKTYTVILNAINFAGLGTKVHSKKFTTDNSAPFYTGNEDDLPKRRFLSNLKSLKVVWERFVDSESPVEFYEIGVGSRSMQDDIEAFTKTGLGTSVEFSSLDLKDNQVYYITVRASNAAGLVRTLLLETAVVDQSPPTARNSSVKDGVSEEDIDFISVNDSVSASWDDIDDLESGLDMFEYCVGTTPHNCLIKPFTLIYQNRSFSCQDCEIHADMKVYSKIRATNGAGLASIFTSDGVYVDSSPPDIGRVYDGERSEIPDAEKIDRDWLPSVTWFGAQDIQSGLKECQWIIEEHDGINKVVVYEKTLGKANITYNIRHTETTDVLNQLKTNALYVNVIRCSNNAGITSHQYSNGFSLVHEWPLTSYIYDGIGSQDVEYDVIGEYIGASWGAFYGDSTDPVIGYEWAVGTLGSPEDIMDFTEVELDTRVSKSLSDSDIELEPGVRYYVTVRATSRSGRTSNETSNGFIVDKTPPAEGVVNVAHNIIDQNTNKVDYILTWEGFSDSESGIHYYEICLGYITNVCSTIITTSDSDTQATIQHFKAADLDTSFYGIVIATNRAGLKTTVSSAAIKLDFTPPVPGTVIDGLNTDLDYINATVPLISTWSTFTDQETGIERCILTVSEENPVAQLSMTTVFKKAVNASGSITHDFILIPGLQYISTVKCMNTDGFKSSASSNGIVVDETAPTAGSIFYGIEDSFGMRYQSSTSSLEVQWTLGQDLESGIKEYLVAVGTGPNQDDVRGFFNVGKATNVVIANLTMSSGSTYYVTLEFVNNADLKSRVSSSGITIDESPPVITKINLETSRALSAYLGPGDNLNGNWDAYDDESGIDFTEYCVGTTPGGCQAQDMQRVPENHTSVTCFECKLQHRYTYFITIRVWNKAGLFSLATSKGVTVDLTPPTVGKVVVNERYMSCAESCSLRATFSGFADEETGIKGCEFSVKTADGLTVTPPKETTSENYTQATNLTLTHGRSYKVTVACINTIGERSLAVDSSPVKIDNTPPQEGLVIISPDANHDKRRQHSGCHFLNSTLRVYWTGFQDDESSIAGFRVAVGRAPLEHDVIAYQDLHINFEAKFELNEQYGFSKGDTIFATVEATNKAGLVTKVSSLLTRLLSDTDKKLLNEQNFLCVNV